MIIYIDKHTGESFIVVRQAFWSDRPTSYLFVLQD